MRDSGLQAPWIGLCGEDYEDRFRRKSEEDVIGYCKRCGKELCDGEEIYDVKGGCICETCFIDYEDEEE